MSMPQFSNVVDFELAQRVRQHPVRFENRRKQQSFTEVSQLMTSKLQTTLDTKEVLEIFFNLSHHLISYDALHYLHNSHKLNIRLGSGDILYAVNYRLTFHGEYLGDLFLQHSRKLSEQQLVRFEGLTSSLIFPLRNSISYHIAIQSALNDALTGVGNRTYMNKTLGRDMDAARRSGQPLAVIMLDIDHFKSINDNHGHNCGDLVLIEVTNTLKLLLRSSDAIFRFGGEEFLISLPNTELDSALAVAERIRQSIEDMKIHFEHKQILVSASLGCAIMQLDDDQQELIQRADGALYQAKNHGRNQVCSA